MTVVVGDLAFDNVVYDDGADVLYLHVGDPGAAVEFDESPGGHPLRYDAEGILVGITIVNARWLLEQPLGTAVNGRDAPGLVGASRVLQPL